MKNSDKLTNTPADHDGLQDSEKREMMKRLGKFAMYAAPFTVLAFTQKAQAGTVSGTPGAAGPGGTAKRGR